MGALAMYREHDTCTFDEVPRGRYREIAARSQKFDSAELANRDKYRRRVHGYFPTRKTQLSD